MSHEGELFSEKAGKHAGVAYEGRTELMLERKTFSVLSPSQYPTKVLVFY